MRSLPALLLLLLQAACAGDAGRAAARERTVVHAAVAASLRGTFDELAAAFTAAHPGTAVEPTYTASGVAYQQILAGAPFDLLVSADSGFPAALDAAGRAEPGTVRVYAHGRLALWTSARLPGDVATVQALGARAVRRVAVANPETAPYGRAALEALAAAGVLHAVRPKLVYGQDVSQAAQIALAGADAALLPLPLAQSPPFAAAGTVRPVDGALHRPIAQAVVVVRGREREGEAARAFAAFLESDDARAVLRRHGYSVP